jgi:competence protein CoiA
MNFKFALVDGERREARPGLSGKCDYCEQAMVPKCGRLRVWHWSHREPVRASGQEGRPLV